MLDGIIAKRCDLDYRSGERSGMQKVKNYRSADCVVGGFRYNEGKPVVGSLLLGLYGEDGLLHHVGFTSTIRSGEKKALTLELWRRLGSPATRRAGRADGRPGAPHSGSRSGRSSSSKSDTITSPDTVFATGRSSCAGGLTSRRGNARWIRSRRRRRT